jgi:hypothetical protein
MTKNKLATEVRRQRIDAIVAARTSWLWGPGNPFRVPAEPGDWSASAVRELRERLESLSEDALRLEQLEVSAWLGEPIGPSLFGHEQSHQTIRRTEGRLRQLLEKHPRMTEDTAYRELRLYAQRKGGPPRMERDEFHRLFSAVTRQ